MGVISCHILIGLFVDVGCSSLTFISNTIRILLQSVFGFLNSKSAGGRCDSQCDVGPQFDVPGFQHVSLIINVHLRQHKTAACKLK